VPDDLLPHYRAAEAIVNSGRDLSRAEPHYRKYLTAEPEGNTPPLDEAQRKLGMLIDKLSRPSAAGMTARR
jgi:hypothetical protein